MDAAGRIVVPKALRERYGLVGGSYELEVADTPDGIVLRPKGEEVPAVRRSSGWVVFSSGEEGSVDPVAAIERERNHRLRHATGQE